MFELRFRIGELTSQEQRIVTAGFVNHSNENFAPLYLKERLNWLAYTTQDVLVGVLTADLLWDWLYVDELWVDEGHRGHGLGKVFMQKAEEYCLSHQVTGLWLWTQSWQAGGFYEKLGYQEFTRFPDFPKGHHRIGFRKFLVPLDRLQGKR